MLSSLIVTATVIGFSFFSIRYHRNVLEQSVAEQAATLANSLDQIAGSALVSNPETSAIPEGRVDSVVEHCRKIVHRSDQILYIVLSRNDGYSLVHAKDGMLDPAFPKQDWEVRTMSGMWTPPKATKVVQRQNIETEIEHQSSAPRGTIILSEIINHRVFHFSYAFDFSGIQWGWVHLGLDVERFEANMRAGYLITAGVAAVALILGLVASYFFARSLSLPIKALQRYAQQVAGGSLNTRLEFDPSDELGELAESITSMKESLIMSHRCNEAAILQEASLREKEVLLREIHHRVKNNMQILSSLLRLQRRRVDHALVRGALYDSELRIRSMSLIHEKLYQSESLSSVEMGGYVDTLCKELMRMEGGSKARNLDIDIREVSLGLDTALPCGLIINELVSNSLKYAFPDDRDGCVSIKLSHVQNTEFELVVSDNGVGMKKAPDLVNAKSLGLRLVGMLVEQLHGTVNFSNGVGTTVSIRFRESEYRKRL